MTIKVDPYALLSMSFRWQFSMPVHSLLTSLKLCTGLLCLTLMVLILLTHQSRLSLVKTESELQLAYVNGLLQKDGEGAPMGQRKAMELKAVAAQLSGNKKVSAPAGLSPKPAPFRPVVYIKMPKTGSSTIRQLMDRYCFFHNKTCAPDYVDWSIPALRVMKRQELTGTCSPIDIFQAHLFFSYDTMRFFRPDAHYFVSIRDPLSQFKSQYFFNENVYRQNNNSILYGNYINQCHEPFLFRRVVSDYEQCPDANEQTKRLANGRPSADVAIANLYALNMSIILYERYDESLLMMARKLNWSLDDVTYIPVKTGYSYQTNTQLNYQRGPQHSKDAQEKLQKIQASDIKLYEEAVRIFERQLDLYYPQRSVLEADLVKYRALLEERKRRCAEEKAANQLTELCAFMLLDDVDEVDRVRCLRDRGPLGYEARLYYNENVILSNGMGPRSRIRCERTDLKPIAQPAPTPSNQFFAFTHRPSARFSCSIVQLPYLNKMIHEEQLAEYRARVPNQNIPPRNFVPPPSVRSVRSVNSPR